MERKAIDGVTAIFSTATAMEGFNFFDKAQVICIIKDWRELKVHQINQMIGRSNRLNFMEPETLKLIVLKGETVTDYDTLATVLFTNDKVFKEEAS